MKGRILAIDYGERRMGLAISDPLQIIAQGLKTLLVKNDNDAAVQLTKVVVDHEILQIVIGTPSRTDGKESEKAKTIEEFIVTLEKSVRLPIVRIDERYSSKIAKSMLLEVEEKKKRRTKEKIDELAAVVILRSYLDSKLK